MKALKIAAIVAAVLLVAIGGRYLLLNPMAPPDVSGSAAIGGPFTLVNGDGETVTEQDFRGKYMLVYFGYTFCPDVCPTSLQTIAQALALLPEDTVAKLTPVFISVDPARDTPENIGQYVDAFDSRMIGLTGTPEQVAAAAKAYKVYYAKVDEKGPDDKTYVMDHSAITYLMGPDGAFITHFSHGIAPQEMADRLKETVK